MEFGESELLMQRSQRGMWSSYSWIFTLLQIDSEVWLPTISLTRWKDSNCGQPRGNRSSYQGCFAISAVPVSLMVLEGKLISLSLGILDCIVQRWSVRKQTNKNWIMFIKNIGKPLPICQPSKLIIIIKCNVTYNVSKGGCAYLFPWTIFWYAQKPLAWIRASDPMTLKLLFSFCSPFPFQGSCSIGWLGFLPTRQGAGGWESPGNVTLSCSVVTRACISQQW